MHQSIWNKIAERFWELPDDCRYTQATEVEVQAFESEFGPIPDDFRRFLLELGGGTIGSEWVDGIRDLADTHRKFNDESKSPQGWKMKDVFAIGWDGCGNPFGIERSSGRIVMEDHNFGGIHEVSPSLEAFLTAGLEVV